MSDELIFLLIFASVWAVVACAWVLKHYNDLRTPDAARRTTAAPSLTESFPLYSGGKLEKISCKMCAFSWDRGAMLQCVRHAPVPIAYTGDGPVPDNLGQAWVFPTVFDNHRCGEFERNDGGPAI